MTFFDTAEVYGPYTNEDLVGEALQPVRDGVAIATKFGFNIVDGKMAGLNSRPEHLRAVADASLAVPGTTKRHRLDANIAAVGVHLAAADLRDIDRAASQIEVHGARYPEHLLKMVGR